MRWIVKSKSERKFRVRIGRTNRVHAKSILYSVKSNPDCPSDLVLRPRWSDR